MQGLTDTDSAMPAKQRLYYARLLIFIDQPANQNTEKDQKINLSCLENQSIIRPEVVAGLLPSFPCLASHRVSSSVDSASVTVVGAFGIVHLTKEELIVSTVILQGAVRIIYKLNSWCVGIDNVCLNIKNYQASSGLPLPHSNIQLMLPKAFLVLVLLSFTWPINQPKINVCIPLANLT